MTSDRPEKKTPDEAYVWIWLPGATEPVVAGRIARDTDHPQRQGFRGPTGEGTESLE